jgi:hypothetical protein
MKRSPWPLLLLFGLALAFFGSLLLAATLYPPGYNWRHTVMSSLASPRENPAAFQIAAYGMAASGVLLSLLGFFIHGSLRAYAPKWTAWACFFFVLGGVLLTISALITPGHHSLFGLAKAHAKMAQAAGVGFGLAMALNLPAILRLPARHAWVRTATIVLVALPMTSYLLCRIFLPIIEDDVSPSAQLAIQHSVLGSLAFWEWVGSVSVYLFAALLVLNIERTGKPAPSPARR